VKVVDLLENSFLQQKFVEESPDNTVWEKANEVLQVANECADTLKCGPSDALQEKQNNALRCCLFLLNYLANLRIKEADVLPEAERKKAFGAIKEDFLRLISFADEPQILDAYLFKCDEARRREIALIAALSFSGGNTELEADTAEADRRRMCSFHIMLEILNK